MFFGLKSYGFEHFQAFPELWRHKKSIFSKSKPLNENRLDNLFASFHVNIHRKRANWIWKPTTIMLFYSIFQKSWKIAFFSPKIDFQKFFQIAGELFQELCGTLPDLEHAQELSPTHLKCNEAILRKWEFSLCFFFLAWKSMVDHFQAFTKLWKHKHVTFSKNHEASGSGADRL